MFLQAAGMGQKKVRSIAEQLDGPALTPRERGLIEFARRITLEPRAAGPEDLAALARLLAAPGDELEAAAVAAGFNFANRCADALGVREEVPRFLRRLPRLRWWVMGLLSQVIRLRTEMRNRPPAEVAADRLLAALQADMDRAGLGALPLHYERLRQRPDLLEVQAIATRAALLQAELPRETKLSLIYLISRLNGDDGWAGEAARLLRQAGIALAPLDAAAEGGAEAGLPPPAARLLAFARDVTLHADRTSAEQVAALRCDGWSDPQLLDLAALAGLVNAGNRLDRVLAVAAAAGPPATRRVAEPPAAGLAAAEMAGGLARR